MIQPRLYLCNGAEVPPDHPLLAGRKVVKLATDGADSNVMVKFEDVARVFGQHVTGRFADLLEIAAFVYSADCATRRSEQWTDDATEEPWDRQIALAVAVRDVEFWQRPEVTASLVGLLRFLSNDQWDFAFFPREATEIVQGYLDFGERDSWQFTDVERVLMFSGGLDSLAGAVDTLSQGKPAVLVSHRPVSLMDTRQRALVRELRSAFGNLILHVPVWLNKDRNLGREFTQRTRSFLFASLGVIVARSVRAGGVRFFENGVVSLNFPVADEVLRARASRTTHPEALYRLSQWLAKVSESDVVIDNPFLFKTKADVVSAIAERGQGRLIGLTRSCAHSMGTSRNQWHCGTCSQCIDRRVAILATGQDEHDPWTDYVSEVFTGPRREGYERNMAVDFARHALDLDSMDEQVMASRFNLEITRAVRRMPGASRAAKQLVDLHQRHATTVMRVLNMEIEAHHDDIVRAALPETSMLALVAGREHTRPTWVRFADRIAHRLQAAIPIACKTDKPKHEPHLQEICDGVLVGESDGLVREYPFLRWGSVNVKPDWSDEARILWVELKYIRRAPDRRVITEDIAADITKYGDVGRRVLYVVYDPNHLVADDSAFAEEVNRRPTMMMRFIR